MTRNRVTSTRRSLGVAAGLIASATLLAPAALAGGFLDNSQPNQPSKPSWAAPAKRMPVEGEGTAAMEAQLENAEARLREAIQNAATAEYQYTRARTRRYPRGDALQEIKNRVAEMNKERNDAERDFIATVDEARAGGVPAGTLMHYMDLADEIRAGASRGSGG